MVVKEMCIFLKQGARYYISPYLFNEFKLFFIVVYKSNSQNLFFESNLTFDIIKKQKKNFFVAKKPSIEG